MLNTYFNISHKLCVRLGINQNRNNNYYRPISMVNPGSIVSFPAGSCHPRPTFTWLAAQCLIVVPLDPFSTAFQLAIILSSSAFLFSRLVTDCQASSTAHLLCSRQLVSWDWHAHPVSRTDLPACATLLLKFLCQIPDEKSVAGSACLTGLSPPVCLMKRTPTEFIIKTANNRWR